MDDKKYYEERPNANQSESDDSDPRRNTEDGPRYQYQPGRNPYSYHQSPDPGQNPYDSRPPMRPQANPLALSSFIVSILSFVLCCCSPNLLMIGSIAAIGLAICSKIFYKGTPMHGLAIAAIVIACVGIILNICMLILSVVWLPQYLKANPDIVEEMQNFISQYGADLSDSFYY